MAGKETAAMEPVTLGAEERALLVGDLSKLSEDQRASLVDKICRSIGLNPLTRPLQYIMLNGKLTLYATKDCTDQLRRINRVGTQIVNREMLPGEIYCVVARALLPDGRQEERIGAVSVAGLRGDALANALMKAETKAVRRVSLGACGMGFLDESEVETIPGAYAVQVREEKPKQITAGNGHSADDAPAPEAWRTRLEERAAELLETTGQVMPIPVKLTRAEATALGAQIKRLQDDAAAFAADPTPESAVV